MARRRSGRAFALFAGLAAAIAGWRLGIAYRDRLLPPPPPVVRPAPSAPATTITDPLAPDRPVAFDRTPRAADAGDWISARPSFQYSLSSEQRGGVNPCAMPGVDTSGFENWTNLARGRFISPKSDALDATGGFDLVLNFHGDELARRELVESGEKFVLYSLTLGPDEDYAPLFAGSKFHGYLVQQVELLLGQKYGVTAHARHVALTAWSAGFMAVLSTIAQPEAQAVDAVVLIDGLHGTRGALEHPFKTLVDFARRAEKGERFLYITHSSIDPPNFSSTTESAHYLISALGGRPEAVRRKDRAGLELIEYFTRGDLHIRGYAGNDKADHCAQVTLLRDAFAAIGRRWKKGTGPQP
ncbi:MAG TPA: hypothetical protein VGK73_06930 [Polyangiaceae bacterium]